MAETEPDNLVIIDTDEELNSDRTTPVLKDLLPYMQCAAGCIIPEDKDFLPLSCFHSICSNECLAKMKANSSGEPQTLFCRVCKSEVTHGDLKHWITRSSKDIVKKSRLEDIIVSCGYCVNELPAVAFCADCDFGLCLGCKEYHPKQKSTHNHTIDENLEEEKNKLLTVLQENAKKCPNHGDSNKTHLCFSCTESMCKICIEKHTDHDTCNLEEEYNEMKTYVKVARSVVINTNTGNNDVEEIESKLKSEWEKEKKIFKMKSSTLINALLTNEIQSKIAERRYLNNIRDLKAKSKFIEKGATQSDKFLKVCADTFDSQDKLGTAMLLKQYRPALNILSEYDKKFMQGYTTLQKMNAGLESPHKQSQQGFEVNGRIEYFYKLQQRAGDQTKPHKSVYKFSSISDSSRNVTFSDNAIPSTSAGILNTNNTNGTPKLQPRFDRDPFNGAVRSSVSIQPQPQETTTAMHSVQKSICVIDERQDHSTPSLSSTSTDRNLNCSNRQATSSDMEVDSSSEVDEAKNESAYIIITPSSAVPHEASDQALSKSAKQASENHQVDKGNHIQSLDHDRPVGASPKPTCSSLPEKTGATNIRLGKRKRNKTDFYGFPDDKKRQDSSPILSRIREGPASLNVNSSKKNKRGRGRPRRW